MMDNGRIISLQKRRRVVVWLPWASSQQRKLGSCSTMQAPPPTHVNPIRTRLRSSGVLREEVIALGDLYGSTVPG